MISSLRRLDPFVGKRSTLRGVFWWRDCAAHRCQGWAGIDGGGDGDGPDGGDGGDGGDGDSGDNGDGLPWI